MTPFRLSLFAGALLTALSARAQPAQPQSVGDFIDEKFDELESKNGVQHQIPTPPHGSPQSDAEKRFLNWFNRTPDESRLDGNWLLVNEADDGETRVNQKGLKTDAGLERTLIVSVTGSGATKTALAIGTNIDGVNQTDAHQDHVTSPVEFSITGGFMRFQFAETFSEDAPVRSCDVAYWCRNWDRASHLVCQVETACLRQDKSWTETKLYHQDFVRATEAPKPDADASLVPPVPDVPDGALLPGMDLKAPPGP